MYKHSPRRNRAKGFKVKHALQICVVIAICIWLLYQVQHSSSEKKGSIGDGSRISGKVSDGNDYLKLGRRDLDHSRVVDISNEGEKEDEKKYDEETRPGEGIGEDDREKLGDKSDNEENFDGREEQREVEKMENESEKGMDNEESKNEGGEEKEMREEERKVGGNTSEENGGGVKEIDEEEKVVNKRNEGDENVEDGKGKEIIEEEKKEERGRAENEQSDQNGSAEAGEVKVNREEKVKNKEMSGEENKEEERAVENEQNKRIESTETSEGEENKDEKIEGKGDDNGDTKGENEKNKEEVKMDGRGSGNQEEGAEKNEGKARENEKVENRTMGDIPSEDSNNGTASENKKAQNDIEEQNTNKTEADGANQRGFGEKLIGVNLDGEEQLKDKEQSKIAPQNTDGTDLGNVSQNESNLRTGETKMAEKINPLSNETNLGQTSGSPYTNGTKEAKESVEHKEENNGSSTVADGENHSSTQMNVAENSSELAQSQNGTVEKAVSEANNQQTTSKEEADTSATAETTGGNENSFADSNGVPDDSSTNDSVGTENGPENLKMSENENTGQKTETKSDSGAGEEKSTTLNTGQKMETKSDSGSEKETTLSTQDGSAVNASDSSVSQGEKDSSSEKIENGSTVADKHNDSSVIPREEKDARTDLATLPEAQTEGNTNHAVTT